MAENYYVQNLHGLRLHEVYQTRHPQVKSYLNQEIAFVQNRLEGSETVLELGAGYGRIMKELAPYCRTILGIDISVDNIAFSEDYLQEAPNAKIILMDANLLKTDLFQMQFDTVLCLQNALSAMKAVPHALVKQIMELLPPGGRVFISTYSESFWSHRLAWFQEQAEKGLLGELDLAQCKEGVIVGKDGFRSYSHSAAELEDIGTGSGYPYEILEVAASALFLIITKVPQDARNTF